MPIREITSSPYYIEPQSSPFRVLEASGPNHFMYTVSLENPNEFELRVWDETDRFGIRTFHYVFNNEKRSWNLAGTMMFLPLPLDSFPAGQLSLLEANLKERGLTGVDNKVLKEIDKALKGTADAK